MIFISYRREDSQDAAWALADKLASRYGQANVFLDREAIGLGDEWRARVDHALEQARIVLVMIGPHWLSITDRWGRRRIDQADDVLAYELFTAHQNDVEVVPLYLHGMKPLPPEALPNRLTFLADRHGLPFEIPRDLSTVYAKVESCGVALSSKIESDQRSPILPVGGFH